MELRPVNIVHPIVDGKEVIVDREDEILTPEALEFLKKLHVNFSGRRAELLRDRHDRRQQLVNGRLPQFLVETKDIREDDSWKVAPLGPGLEDRRVEMTGPTDRKMTINALNSGAAAWMADFEDANTPHWENVIGGQVNLKDAIAGTITFDSPEGKHYELKSSDIKELPTLLVRPRGWHLVEKHIKAGNENMVGALVDFGLYFFHNAKTLIEKGRGPYFYLPKMESHREARLWADVFTYAEEYVGIPHGTIRATCLIETIMAAFEMEEFLYELRDYSAGLNAGRWDYIFSIIKKFRDSGAKYVLPDRADVGMTAPMMRAYTELLVKTCHKRGASAIGGMSAFIPSRDAAENAEIEKKVRGDKAREAGDGFDGSWCAHPGMVPYIRDEFDKVLGTNPNQISKQRPEVDVKAEDLLNVAATPGKITEGGVRTNISVSLRYLEAWLGGNGAVGIFGLMEDAATAEISRAQIWQWVHNKSKLDDGREVTREFVEALLKEESYKFAGELSGDEARLARLKRATELFGEISLSDTFPTFLTLQVYANDVA
ncbi:MAG: malate synthase A [Mobiluncus porci]|uniref:malate synthase A n=1 Tax=Mobiluncus porci TaxID=2652278 RepID=UPI0023F16F1D|nr:malate synthase A [Mobiluncus porci]MDD7541319.1 malate synthase A [Mobiluncus porci]MDY5747802.1 malate synthase A [Mobiluncus porci]